MRRPLTYLILAIFFSSCFQVSLGQKRLTIAQAVFLIDKPQSSVYDSLARKNYSYKEEEAGFDKFQQITGYEFSLRVAFKNKRLIVISWDEHVMYAPIIMGEILRNGFVLDDRSIVAFQAFKNQPKELMLNLIDNSSMGYITIIVGKIK